MSRAVCSAILLTLPIYIYQAEQYERQVFYLYQSMECFVGRNWRKLCFAYTFLVKAPSDDTLVTTNTLHHK